MSKTMALFFKFSLFKLADDI
uniref:Uncharacterized protein n=1 Tax=Anguilla anguilla TaxID=7936 RepID=A0A0E9T3L5_ANGAN